MRRLIIVGLITIILVLLNKVIPINFLFETGKLEKSLFRLVSESSTDSTIVILNIGELKDSETAGKIDSIILKGPRAIGLDLCGISSDSLLRARFQNKSIVTILNCNNDSAFSSSVIDHGDDVSRFKTDNPDYFEIKLADSWDKIADRENQSELINYKGVTNRFVTADLKEMTSIPLNNKIVLISYLGATIPSDIYYSDLQSTGLYQIQYSAYIISTIINDDYINDGNFILELILTIVVVSLNYWLLTLIKVKNAILGTVIAYATMSLISAGVIGLVWVLFTKGLYLHTNGLTSILVITTLYTCLTKNEGLREERN